MTYHMECGADRPALNEIGVTPEMAEAWNAALKKYCFFSDTLDEEELRKALKEIFKAMAGHIPDRFGKRR